MDNDAYRSVKVEELTPGMILYRRAVTPNGRVALNGGTILNEKNIRGLKTWLVSQVEIIAEEDLILEPQTTRQQVSVHSEDEEDVERLLDEIMPDVCLEKENVVEEPVSLIGSNLIEDDCFSEPLPEVFENEYKSAVLKVKNELAKARFLRDSFSVENMKDIVSQVLVPLIEDPVVFWKLQFVKHTEDYLYHHSVDVAILAGCISRWLGFSEQMQQKLMWGGLLHDVGKTLVPLKVVNKPGTLTSEEWNLAQRHATRGYKYLRRNFDVPREILYCVLQHHERLDGSGYPLAVKGDKIDIGARVIAVADVYSAMTSARCYGKRFTSYDAAATLQEEMFSKLDSHICSLFLEKLRLCFHANRVCLSDGNMAEVVYLNNSDDSRPMVRTGAGEIINLNLVRNLKIQRIVLQ